MSPLQYTKNKNVNKESSTQSQNPPTINESETRLSPDRASYVLPVPSKETCQGGREGISTHAVESIRARDMSVGGVICDQPL